MDTSACVKEDVAFDVFEIYKSVQGEAAFSGLPCTFIRLAKCPLRCRWCDTTYAFASGKTLSLEEIVSEAKTLNAPYVELTGGEPLAQAHVPQLIDRLIAEGFRVMIETSGCESIEGLSPKLHIIMDLKCPGSGMSGAMLWSNFDHLKASDELKCVIASKEDFEWAHAKVLEHGLGQRCQVLYSPAFGLVKPADLVSWMLEIKEYVPRLNLQIHKSIWHPRAKGV